MQRNGDLHPAYSRDYHVYTLGLGTIFGALDGKSRYWPLTPLEKESNKSPFCTSSWIIPLYPYAFLPCKAWGKWPWVKHVVQLPVKGHLASAYLDDIVISQQDPVEYISHLQMDLCPLQKAKSYGRSRNVDFSRIGLSTISWHVIGPSSIEIALQTTDELRRVYALKIKSNFSFLVYVMTNVDWPEHWQNFSNVHEGQK